MSATDLENAVARLTHAIQKEEDRRIVFLTGSGISLPEVPSTEEMVEIICAEMDAKSHTQGIRVAGKPVALQYREAAQLLKQRVGQRGLDAAIRKGVLRAVGVRGSLPSSTSPIDDSAWRIPVAQDLLGKLIARIPAHQMGAVITTNFDPLTEVSLRKHGVHATTLAVPGTSAFPVDSVYGTLPIVHLHGFWDMASTLSTPLQLAHERPDIQKMITRLMDRSIVVVIGYGGWDDSFTRALMDMLRSGQLTSLDTEILWFEFAHRETVITHPFLSKVDGHPGISVYAGIDAVKVLSGVLESVGIVGRVDREPFLGWSYPPNEIAEAPRKTMLNYIDGAQPDWEIANSVPLFQRTGDASAALEKILATKQDGSILLAGPAAEGKSTALRQIAIQCDRQHPESTVIFRNAGAPRITADWLNYLRARNDQTVLVVDDADLVLDQISTALESLVEHEGGSIVWVLGIHSSFLHAPRTKRSLAAIDPDIIEINQFGYEDAQKLARSWMENSLVPEKLSGRSPSGVADIIITAGRSSRGTSLFGSILSIWDGEELTDRVGDLLARVAGTSISGVSFKHLLASVAVVQVAWDLYEDKGRGIHLSVLAEMAHIKSPEVLRMVVEPLGREVGLSRIGERVYVRHPSIAKVIYDLLEAHGELDQVLESVASSGAEMRFSEEYSRSEYYEAYMLFKQLPGPQAVTASVGSVKGSGDYLEPRVSMTASLRNNGELKRAQAYVNKLAENLTSYADYKQVGRGLFVEWSVVESRLGNYDRAIELSLLSLSDQVEGNLDAETLQYGLMNVAVPARKSAASGEPRFVNLEAVVGKALNKFSNLDSRRSRYVNHNDTSTLIQIMGEFVVAARGLASKTLTFRKMQQSMSSGERETRPYASRALIGDKVV